MRYLVELDLVTELKEGDFVSLSGCDYELISIDQTD